jgi:C4-dicarboxylate-specific signal transduction histidine kinase
MPLRFVSFVAMLELADGLAHEVNQPLAAILANARAAQAMLTQQHLDRAVLLEILEDIAADGVRAGALVYGWRMSCQPGPTCQPEQSEGDGFAVERPFPSLRSG